MHVASLESALKTQKTDEDLGLGADGERARAHTQELRCDAEIALTFMFKLVTAAVENKTEHYCKDNVLH